MRFAIYSEREQRRRDDRQTMDGGQVRIPRRRAEYEYRCRSRTAFSPAGSVRVGYGLPSAGHSLPSALRCPKFLARCRSRNFDRCLLPPQAADVCQTVICINFVLRHPRYRLAAALRCPKFLARYRFAKFRPLHVSRLAFFRHRRRQGAKPRSNPLHIKREKHFCEVLFSFGSRIGIRTPTYRVRVCCATVTQFGCICF